MSFDETTNEFTNIAMWNVKKGKAITIKRIVEVLRNNQYTAEVSRRLYAYYKYFSQYEHFSESGYGDTLADFDKDNVSFEKAFECLRNGMDMLLEMIIKFINSRTGGIKISLHYNPRDSLISNRNYCKIKKMIL